MTCIVDDLGDEAMTTDIEADDMVDHNGNELISLEPLRSLTMDGLSHLHGYHVHTIFSFQL
jgi:hypothetical protein